MQLSLLSSFLKIDLPNPSYIILLGTFIFVLGIAYYYIYKGDLRKNRDLIKVGTLYKFAYAAVAIYVFLIGIIPHMLFLITFGIIDLIFGALFIECLKSTQPKSLPPILQ